MKMLPWMYNLEIIEKTTPKLRYDGSEDFKAWQMKARTKLFELLGMQNLKKSVNNNFKIEYVKEEETYTEYRFTLESEPGYTFPSVMRVPKGIEGKIPVILCLQGHSKGMHISLGNPIYEGDVETISGGDRVFVVRALKEGYAAIAIEQRNFGE